MQNLINFGINEAKFRQSSPVLTKEEDDPTQIQTNQPIKVRIRRRRFFIHPSNNIKYFHGSFQLQAIAVFSSPQTKPMSHASFLTPLRTVGGLSLKYPFFLRLYNHHLFMVLAQIPLASWKGAELLRFSYFDFMFSFVINNV